jgi:hypothetical protein
MQGEAKAPGEILKTFYLQRRCAVVIAGLAWSGLGVQLYFDVQEALIKNQPVHVFNFFSFFTIQGARSDDFLHTAASGTISDRDKRRFGACGLHYRCRRGL